MNYEATELHLQSLKILFEKLNFETLTSFSGKVVNLFYCVDVQKKTAFSVIIIVLTARYTDL